MAEELFLIGMVKHAVKIYSIKKIIGHRIEDIVITILFIPVRHISSWRN